MTPVAWRSATGTARKLERAVPAVTPMCRALAVAGCRQYAADMPLPGDPADPDMCVHLWPGLCPGAVEAFGDGLAAVEEGVADEVCDRAVEEVEALAMLSPSASVAPSTAAPAAVPMSGLLILTRFSFREVPALAAPAGERIG